MDPMVNHYTANKRKRSTDSYTPDGVAGFRPDYATTVYTEILKELYPEVPVLIGGIEASLRRVTHNDYWSDKLMQSIMESSKADLLVYGMGEQSLREILKLLKKEFHSPAPGEKRLYLRPKTTGLLKNKNWTDLHLASHEDCLNDKKTFAPTLSM